MRLFRFTIVICALIIVSAGCYKRCEDFDYDLIQWLPYDESDKIPLLSMCLCENTFGVGLSSDSLKVFVTFFDSGMFREFFVSINDEHLDFHQYLESYEINGKEYFDLIEYTDYNRVESVKFNTVIIAKSIGFIAIIGSSKEWKIVNDSNREIVASGIETNIIEC